MPSYVHLKEVVTNDSAKLHVYLRKTSGSISGIPCLALSQSLCTFCEISNETLRNLVLSILYADSASAAEDILTGSRVNQSYDWNYQAAPLPLVEIKKKPPTNEKIAPSKASTSERTSAKISASFVLTDGNNVQSVTEVLPSDDSMAVSTTSEDHLSPTEVLGDITNTVDHRASVPGGNILVKSGDPFEALANTSTSRPKTILIQGQGFSNAPLDLKSRGQPQAGPNRKKEKTTSTGTAARPSAHTVCKINGRQSLTKLDQRPLTDTGRSTRTPPLALVRDTFFKSKEDEAREEEIGVQGELSVFRTLQHIMGDQLDQDCWTSELRSQAGDEFTEWQPKDNSEVYCDFTVHDEGALTAWLFEEGYMHGTRSAATTYHIEVKSTTAGYDEPYHVSALQMEKCQQLSEAGGGKDVFVIFRVYDLCRGGRLMVYVDPWKEIVAGKLGREADGWLVWDTMT